MAGIALGFVTEGIVCDDAVPFLRGADEEIRSVTEALLGFCFQQALQIGARSPVASENEIAALEQRSCFDEA